MHSGATRSTRVGPQKLYSKLINKINHFPHKSNKLAVKHQQPLQPDQKRKTLVIEIDTVASNSERAKQKEAATNGHAHDYENVLVSRLPGSEDNCAQRSSRSKQSGGEGVGSGGFIPLTATAAALFSSGSDKDDDQYPLSLEDEIFEELEKVAHDEAKLTAALENFDKILSEYNDRGLKAKSRNIDITATAHDRTANNKTKSRDGPATPLPSRPAREEPKGIGIKLEGVEQKQRPDPTKILHKSKTCSIIESKCILKKASPDDETRHSSVSLPNAQLSNVCLARSLLNLKDLEEFAKISPVATSSSATRRMERVSEPANYCTYKVKNSNVAPSTDSSKSPSPKISNASANQAKSQLPRAKSVWELGNTTPPNSHAPASRTNSGSKIPISTTSSRSNSFILNSGSTMSLLSVSAAKLNDCRLKSSESNVNKMRSSTSTSSICVRPVTGRIQSAISEMSLRSQPRSYKKSKENGDELLNKCLEKGHEILKKVEELSSTNHHQKGKVKLTVKSTFQSNGLKSSTNSTLRLNASDETDGCRNARQAMTKPNVHRNNVSTNNVKNNNRKDNISSSSAKGFSTINKLNSNDDISLHGHSRSHKSNLVATTSCPTSVSSDSRSKKQQNNAIVIVNRKQTNSSATQTSTGAFESKSATGVAVSSHQTNSLSKASNSGSANSVMEQKNISVKSKNIVKNCISNFENQCKTTSSGSDRVTNNNLKNENGKSKSVPGRLSSGRSTGSVPNLMSVKVPTVGEKKPLNWKQSISTLSELTIPPPLKSPALVKQNKLTISSASNVGKTAYKTTEVITNPLLGGLEEFTPIPSPPAEPLLPTAAIPTTTVIVVPPSPLPPSDDPEPDFDILDDVPSKDLYHDEQDPDEKDDDEEEEEEEYDEEEERVIDHLKCVNKKNASEKEETYQSDCSDDSGHISNENNEHEENLKPIPGKLTESLLEIFEQNCKKSAESSSGGGSIIRGNSLFELCNNTGDNSGGCDVAISEPKKLFNKNEVKLTNVTAVIVAAKSVDGCSAAVVCDKNAATSCTEIVPYCNTEVLFRSGVLNQLEAKRDELLSDRIIQLQAYCRGHLARKRLAQRRVQELAVKCIQRNVRAFLKVREWPWWRLLVRVTPLLNVHRTEEQLKIATNELQLLKAKLEKVESERTNLKTENSKLESRLSEMTAELAEEHSSSNLISERLGAETTERLRLEKEVKEHESKYRNLQESSEKLEMELLCAKSDLNGDLDDDLESDETGGNAYRLKYERVARELEFTKKRLQTQHEHDLEQLIGLKKQLEKKLADAYEEVEEQRQVVGQWKRKAQKMTNEMNDLRMLLEEQNSRNNLLEKRQRKFDSECQALQDSARQEKQTKERLAREKDVLIAEKFTIEQSLSDVRLELELKEEKYSALQRELEEMTFGGGTEEEIAQLKRQKMELDRRCKEQEEELDEMAGQIQLLEQAKLRLEMSLETMRKDARKEAQQRDDELEEVRGGSYKKIKSLECQLEQEHEERTLLLREKHELERRLNNLEDQDRAERAAEEAASQKLKRDLRKYKALLRDAQSQLERAKTDSAGKALIRQLRNQLEDAESARSAAVKVRQVAEGELQDVQLMLEEAQRARFDAEEKATSAQRDRTELQAQIDENEEEMAELMKKYSTTVKQLSSEQAIIADYEFKMSELESEKKSLKEQISDLQSRLESVENIGDSSSSIQFKRLELRTKELESRLEFEQATRARMEIQLNRHKDSLEKAQGEISQTRTKEMHAQDALKKAQKTIRELREELHLTANKEQETLTKRKDLEKRLETVEAEAASARADLRLALQRIADLQQAMEEGDSYHSDSENSDSSIDSVSEINYRSPSHISSLRSRSGETNGTSSNGSSTTLCIREEKENTPRIRSKYKGRPSGRRRLPFAIKEEEEEEHVSTYFGEQPKQGKATEEAGSGDFQIDSVIESIKSAINDDNEPELEPNPKQQMHKNDPPKYTGAIKKTANITVQNMKNSGVQRSPSDELEYSPLKRITGSSNPLSNEKDLLSESTMVGAITDASKMVAGHLQDDARFDLDALKSIKEKIKNLNRSLKEEEAAQDRCPKYEFPTPSVEPPVPDVIKERSHNNIADLSKLDQISSQLNVDGIRSMKEKIRNLKKKLQDESGSPAETASKEHIISEISEMKKTLTVAFMNKGCEKGTLSRSSSQKDDSSISSLKRENKSASELAQIPNGLSKDSSLKKVEQQKKERLATSSFIDSGSMDNPLSLVSSLSQGEVDSKPLSDAADNNEMRQSLLECANPREHVDIMINADRSYPDSSVTLHKESTCTVFNNESVETLMRNEKIAAVHTSSQQAPQVTNNVESMISDEVLTMSFVSQFETNSTITTSDNAETELEAETNVLTESNRNCVEENQEGPLTKTSVEKKIIESKSSQIKAAKVKEIKLEIIDCTPDEVDNDKLQSSKIEIEMPHNPTQTICDVFEETSTNPYNNGSISSNLNPLVFNEIESALPINQTASKNNQNNLCEPVGYSTNIEIPLIVGTPEEQKETVSRKRIDPDEEISNNLPNDNELQCEENISKEYTNSPKIEGTQCNDVQNEQFQTDLSSICLNNSCSKTAVCQCENIDRTIDMLIESMERNVPRQRSCINLLTDPYACNGKQKLDGMLHIDIPDTLDALVVNEPKYSDRFAELELPSLSSLQLQSSVLAEKLKIIETSDMPFECENQVDEIKSKQELLTETYSSLSDVIIEGQNVESINKFEDVVMLTPPVAESLLDPNTTQGNVNMVVQSLKIDENNNEGKTEKPLPIKAEKGIFKSNSKSSYHGSLKRTPKHESKTSGSRSNPSSRRSSLCADSSPRNTIYSDLAKGDPTATASSASKTLTKVEKVVEVPLAIKNPIEDITNQVSERALVVNRTALVNDRSSCSVIPLHAAVVSTDVTSSKLVSTPTNATTAVNEGHVSDHPQKQLSYAESLKKARSPPKFHSSPARTPVALNAVEPWRAIRNEYAAKAATARNSKQQQQQGQQRVRHSSLARGGNHSNQPDVTIRQSKSASKLSSKELSLPNGKPSELKPSGSVAKIAKSKSGQLNKSLGGKGTNKSNPNMLLDQKLQEVNTAKGSTQQPEQKNNHRRPQTAHKKK